jgi:cation:H+ antiporter
LGRRVGRDEDGSIRHQLLAQGLLLQFAAAISAPELIVTLAALRLGVLNMGIANLLSGNLFNMGGLAIDDIPYRPGSFFAAMSPTHAEALAAVIMSEIVIAALLWTASLLMLISVRVEMTWVPTYGREKST